MVYGSCGLPGANDIREKQLICWHLTGNPLHRSDYSCSLAVNGCFGIALIFGVMFGTIWHCADSFVRLGHDSVPARFQSFLCAFTTKNMCVSKDPPVAAQACLSFKQGLIGEKNTSTLQRSCIWLVRLTNKSTRGRFARATGVSALHDDRVSARRRPCVPRVPT